MAQHDIERIDCVELVPEEKETARFFKIENGDIFNDPRFNFIVGDGRNHLLTTTRTYDVISINAIHPAMSPYLYTSDFYQVCKAKLNPDGVICVWIPLNSSYFNILLHTFQSVFPRASLWDCTTQHILLIGSNQPLALDYYQWCKNISRQKVTASLAEVLLHDPVRLLSQMILDEQGIKAIAADAAINTDDWPIVQFETNPNEARSATNRQALLAHSGTILPYLKDNIRTDDLSDLSVKLEKYQKAAPYADVGFNFRMAKNLEDAIKRIAAAIYQFPQDERFLFHLGLSWAQVLSRRANSPLLQPGLDSNQRRKLISIFEAAIVETKILDTGKKYGLSETFLAELRIYLSFLYYYENRVGEALQQAEKILQVDPSFKPARELLQTIRLRSPEQL
jgi:tetratricopeptide (TPR) repeat protein